MLNPRGFCLFYISDRVFARFWVNEMSGVRLLGTVSPQDVAGFAVVWSLLLDSKPSPKQCDYEFATYRCAILNKMTRLGMPDGSALQIIEASNKMSHSENGRSETINKY
jgi:hypothetical protein